MQGMVAMLGREHLTERARLVLEKPFGLDLESARELDAALKDVVEEDQVFRIDHFLGKEAVQNILALRFANGLFEPAWNRQSIASVQIDVPEDLGMEGRGSFYESTGCLRDMISTHLCQLLGFVALEDPRHLTADAVRDAKHAVFEAMRPLDPARVVYGQYDGYRDEDDVADDSEVETFVAIEAYVDNDRWRDVPFYLRTGKRLARGDRVITLRFRGSECTMFDDHPTPRPPNDLVLELTDDPRIHVEMRAKKPGPDMELVEATMHLDVGERRPGGDPAGGLRAAAARRAPRRPDAVHPRRRGRPPLAGVRAGAPVAASGAALPARVLGTRGRAGDAGRRLAAPWLRRRSTTTSRSRSTA